MQARTETEIRQLGEYMWEYPNDENLKMICEQMIRQTGGSWENPTTHTAFVEGFVQGYIAEIEAFNRRNRQLY
jgi:hypothetical protein